MSENYIVLFGGIGYERYADANIVAIDTVNLVIAIVLRIPNLQEIS